VVFCSVMVMLSDLWLLCHYVIVSYNVKCRVMLIMILTFFEVCAVLCLLSTGRDSASAPLEDSFLRAARHVRDDSNKSERRPLTRHSKKTFELQQLKVTSSSGLNFAFVVIFNTVLSAYRSRWALPRQSHKNLDLTIYFYLFCYFLYIVVFTQNV